MPVKILLADKSITIQKVVEMLFSGKEYEVTCVSDGETAMNEAARSAPDVVLADVDLPRIDGYTLAAQLHQQAALARTPVILMLSRDDQYDATKGAQAGIVDSIAKPFESKDLIGKVKKAQSSAPAAMKPAAAAPRPAERPAPPAPPRPVAPPPPPQKPTAPPPPKPKPAVPSDIFDIISEAPSQPAVRPAAAAPAPAAAAEESIFEVEPEYEVEPEVELPPRAPAAPVPPRMPERAPAPRAPEPVAREWKPPVETPAAGEAEGFDTDKLFGKEPAPSEPFFGAPEEESVHAEIVSEEPPAATSFDTFDMGVPAEPIPAETERVLPLGARAMEEMREGLGLGRDEQAAPAPLGIESFESLDMATRASEEYAPPVERKKVSSVGAAGISDKDAQDAIARVAREVLERVAWEVIPDLAERLIREEIERLKAGK